MANDYWPCTAYANTDRACYLEARPESGNIWKPYKQKVDRRKGGRAHVEDEEAIEPVQGEA